MFMGATFRPAFSAIPISILKKGIIYFLLQLSHHIILSHGKKIMIHFFLNAESKKKTTFSIKSLYAKNCMTLCPYFHWNENVYKKKYLASVMLILNSSVFKVIMIEIRNLLFRKKNKIKLL